MGAHRGGGTRLGARTPLENSLTLFSMRGAHFLFIRGLFLNVGGLSSLYGGLSHHVRAFLSLWGLFSLCSGLFLIMRGLFVEIL